MASTYKSHAIARFFKDDVAKLVSATLPVVVDSFDSSGNPVITFSADATPAAGEKIVVVRVQPQPDPDAKDILGLTPQSFSPHMIEICTESNFAGTTDNIADILVNGELEIMVAEAAKRGCTVKTYRSANATAPATAQMTAANLKATIQPNQYWNVLSSS